MATLAAAMVLAWSAAAQEPAAPPVPPPAIAVGEDAVSDAAIAERLGGILDAVPAFEAVTARVEAGVVTLDGSVAEGAEAERLRALVERIEGVVAVQGELGATSDVGERLVPALTRIEARLRQAVATIPLLLLGLAAFAAIAGLGVFLTRGWGIYDRLAPNAFIAGLYRTVLRIGFAFAGLVVAIDLLGATALLGTILGAAGIIGLAVGFGVRDTIENFVASVMMSVRQPFAPNDLVEIEGALGRVIRLTSRATVILTPDGNHVRLPNALVFKSKIVNFTRDPHRRFVFDLGVDPDADLAGARDTGVAALARLDFVLDEPPPQAWIADVGASNVVVTFAAWVDQATTEFLLARGEAIRGVKAALEHAGYALPEPIYRLRIEEQGAPSASGDSPAPRRAPPPAPAAEAPKDSTIERKVEADRRSGGAAGDLLRPGAERE